MATTAPPTAPTAPTAPTVTTTFVFDDASVVSEVSGPSVNSANSANSANYTSVSSESPPNSPMKKTDLKRRETAETVTTIASAASAMKRSMPKRRSTLDDAPPTKEKIQQMQQHQGGKQRRRSSLGDGPIRRRSSLEGASQKELFMNDILDDIKNEGMEEDDADNAATGTKTNGVKFVPRVSFKTTIANAMSEENRTEGEIRSAVSRGIISHKSVKNLYWKNNRKAIEDLLGSDEESEESVEGGGGGEGGGLDKKGEKDKQVESDEKKDESDATSNEAEEDDDDEVAVAAAVATSEAAAAPQAKAEGAAAATKTEAQFENEQLAERAEPHSDATNDVLSEGQYYLGISMLVYMYSHLRETCWMGHTRVKMEDIDVNSVQSQYRGPGLTPTDENFRYLPNAKTAGTIIRVVIDELDKQDEEQDEEFELLAGEAREYEMSIMEEFRNWIKESRESQLDAQTEKMIAQLKRKVARHRWKRAIAAVRLSYKLSGGKPPKFEAPVAAPGCERENRFVDMDDIVNQALKNQTKYFREGSVLNNLIESGMEVVWFSDLTQNDVVYGICCQRSQKKVTVVFRGSVSSHNWQMNMKMDTNEYRNPVREEYPGRKEELSLHAGFGLYLMRRRKDTGMSKMQEIFDKIDEIGREMAPDGDYKLSITGHSLGGALATLLAFYVAAKPRFANLERVYVWTFASPRVGTTAFRDAYQYLERKGRIRHARFSATHDIVPCMPFCNFELDDLQFYKHVGVRIQLHNTGRFGKWRMKQALDVTYPKDLDWISEMQRGFANSFVANINTYGGFITNHTLTEIQKRVHFAHQFRQALGSGVYFSDNKRKHMKTIDDYYFIRGNIDNGLHSEIVANERLVQEEEARSVKKSVCSWFSSSFSLR